MIVVIIIISLGYFFMPRVVDYFEWQKAVRAAGSLPYQIGLTNVTMIQCTVSCNGGCCMGGTLCTTKDSATCTTYSEITGTQAGGMGNQALFLNSAISQAGVSSGGQLIAGGMSPVLMDNGVLAGPGGCYGCH